MPVKILSKEELNLFLKELSTESVRKAYQNEANSYHLIEQDPEEEEEDPLFGDEEGDKGDEEGGNDALADLMGGDKDGEDEELDLEEPPKEPEKEKVQIRPTPLTLELGEITSDGLIATLNMIRAGRSFKEADIASQLRKYFEENLNDSERLALATFLSALQDIVSGSPAEDAPEPGDENVNIDATDKERAEHQPTYQKRRMPQRRQSQPRGVEDTSPPIQVGPRDERLSEEYRKHIRSLLV